MVRVDHRLTFCKAMLWLGLIGCCLLATSGLASGGDVSVRIVRPLDGQTVAQGEPLSVDAELAPGVEAPSLIVLLDGKTIYATNTLPLLWQADTKHWSLGGHTLQIAAIIKQGEASSPPARVVMLSGAAEQRPAQPTDDLETFAALTEGVREVGGLACTPDAIMYSAEGCVAVLAGTEAAYTNDHAFSPGTYPPIAVAGSFGAGRVVAWSEQGYLKADDPDGNGVPHLQEYSNLKFALNAVAWCAHADTSLPVAVLESHDCEIRSSGGYDSLIRAIKDAGYQVVGYSGALQAEQLSAFGCLVIGFPRQPFQEREIAALHDYVNGGGGVLLIGKVWRPQGKTLSDHPVNQVATAFGMCFTEATVVDPASHVAGHAEYPLFVATPSPTCTGHAPRALLDSSLQGFYPYREILFDRYLAPAGWWTAWTFDYPSRSELEKYDVLIVPSLTPFLLPDSEIQAIVDWVKRGGGLLIAGNGWQYAEREWADPAVGYPLNRLAQAFGCELTTVRARQPCHFTPAWDLPAGWEVDPASGADMAECVIAAPEHAETVLSDAEGRPVMVAMQVGEGRVVVFGTRLFFSPSDSRRLINEEFVTRLFGWLSEPCAGDYTFRPERRETLAPVAMRRGSIQVHGLPPMQNVAARLFARATEAHDSLERRFGYTPKGIYHVIPIADPAGGGGAAGADDGLIVGAGAICRNQAQEATMTGVIAHEMAHTYVQARLSNLEEPFASLYGYRVVTELGLADGFLDPDPQIPSRLEAWPRRAFEEYDPAGNRLDLSLPPTRQSSNAMFGKGMWVVEELEQAYGDDFMVRCFRYLEEHNVKGPLSTEQVVNYLSEVAGEDQAEWFKSFGTWGGGR
jgi:hypothetical protein